MGDARVADLVVAAADRDKAAWDELVIRFTPLILVVTSSHRLRPEDAADVSQIVWLRLVQHIGDLREPAALPGWIVTTARNECCRLLADRSRVVVVDPNPSPAGGLVLAVDAAGDIADDCAERLDREELRTVLLAAFAELPGRDRALLRLLLSDPPTSYAEVSRRLQMPIGAIGPNRGRAISRLRSRVADMTPRVNGQFVVPAGGQ